jgi:hypothetical protein
VRSHNRRQFLGLASAAVGATLAGCLAEEEEEFLVTNTQIGFEPPSVVVRVTIENISTQRQSGTLEMTLQYFADADADSEPDETWQQTDSVTVKQAASPQLRYRFEDAYREGSSLKNYAFDATLDGDDL